MNHLRDLQDLVEECEALMRNGQTPAVAKRLARLNAAKVPGSFRLPLATICRRAGLVSLGLKLLAPFVAGDLTANPKLPIAESVEYAALLLRIGASKEASELLRLVGPDAGPEADLLRAKCAIESGQMTVAEAHLRKYLKSPLFVAARLKARFKLGEILLATEQLHEAQIFLSETIELSMNGGPPKLQALAHVARAQLHLKSRDVKAMREDLATATSLIGAERATHLLPLQRALASLQACELNSAEPLRHYRAIALEKRDYVGVRETDLLALSYDFQQSDFEYLLFGSPQASFRSRLLAEAEAFVDRNSLSNDFILGPPGTPCFDTTTGEITKSTVLNPGRQTHQVLEILLRDFYQPLRMGSLFAELFPDERYDVASSAHRVHQVLLRARVWLKESGISAEIANEAGSYSLRITGSFSFRIPLERRSIDRYETHIEALRTRFTETWGFSSRDAREVLGLSSTSFKRFAAWALERKLLERHGASSATFYRIAKQTHSQAVAA